MSGHRTGERSYQQRSNTANSNADRRRRWSEILRTHGALSLAKRGSLAASDNFVVVPHGNPLLPLRTLVDRTDNTSIYHSTLRIYNLTWRLPYQQPASGSRRLISNLSLSIPLTASAGRSASFNLLVSWPGPLRPSRALFFSRLNLI